VAMWHSAENKNIGFNDSGDDSLPPMQ